MAREILVVTPNPTRLETLAGHLRELGYKVRMASETGDDPEADLFVVDVVDDALWEAAEELGAGRLVLIVAGPGALARGFLLGADDCVVADAQMEEVAARCEAVLRRTGIPQGQTQISPSVFADRRLWVNFDSRQVWAGGRPAQLTPREFRLLRVLIQNRDETLTHEALLEGVWGRTPATGRTPEVLKQYIWRLRQKIEPDPNDPIMILTDPGAGYRFVSRTE